MNVVAVPIIESNTELQGTRHSSMTARNVGGTTDRNSLSTRQANGAAMLVEVDRGGSTVCGRFITSRSARASKDLHIVSFFQENRV